MLPDFSDYAIIRKPNQAMSFTLSQFTLRALLELNKFSFGIIIASNDSNGSIGSNIGLPLIQGAYAIPPTPQKRGKWQEHYDEKDEEKDEEEHDNEAFGQVLGSVARLCCRRTQAWARLEP